MFSKYHPLSCLLKKNCLKLTLDFSYVWLAIDKYGFLAMITTVVYAMLTQLKIISNKMFLLVCYVTTARLKNEFFFAVQKTSILKFWFEILGFSIEIQRFLSKSNNSDQNTRLFIWNTQIVLGYSLVNKRL